MDANGLIQKLRESGTGQSKIDCAIASFPDLLDDSARSLIDLMETRSLWPPSTVAKAKSLIAPVDAPVEAPPAKVAAPAAQVTETKPTPKPAGKSRRKPSKD